jgi:hypothetical protein
LSPPLEAGGDESSLGSMFNSDNDVAVANDYIVFYRYRIGLGLWFFI